jgi:hypothetical protein
MQPLLQQKDDDNDTHNKENPCGGEEQCER